MADPNAYEKLYQACKGLQAHPFTDKVVLDKLFEVDVEEAIKSYDKLRKVWNTMRHKRKDKVEGEQLESDGKIYL